MRNRDLWVAQVVRSLTTVGHFPSLTIGEFESLAGAPALESPRNAALQTIRFVDACVDRKPESIRGKTVCR